MKDNFFKLKEPLIFPLTWEEFRNKYWSIRPLFVRAEDIDTKDRFQTLLTYTQLELALSIGRLRNSDVRIVHEKQLIPSSEYTVGHSGDINANIVLDYYRQGMTLIFQGVERWSSSCASLCSELSRQWGASVWANAYLTPPDGASFGYHYDSHDVFVLHIYGSKLWRIGSSIVKNPKSGLSDKSVPQEFDSTFEETLTEGDLLYIPRGFGHEASTTSSCSLHVTIGLELPSVSDVLIQYISYAASKNADLRAPIPGFGPSNYKVVQSDLESIKEMCTYFFHKLSNDHEKGIREVISEVLSKFVGSDVNKSALLNGSVPSLESTIMLSPYTSSRTCIANDIITICTKFAEVSLPLVLTPIVEKMLSGEPILLKELSEDNHIIIKVASAILHTRAIIVVDNDE